jgi:hypothetical protein
VLAPFGTVSTSAVVDTGDIQVLSQKCDRVEALLTHAASFKEFIGEVRTLITAARIITTEHLPAETSAKEI